MDDDSDSACNQVNVGIIPCSIAQKYRERHSLCRGFQHRLCLFVLFVRKLE